MKLFRATKWTLDLGFGDAPPEWSRVVNAKSEKQLQKILDRYGIVLTTIRELKKKSCSIDEFEAFLEDKPSLLGFNDLPVTGKGLDQWWDSP